MLKHGILAIGLLAALLAGPCARAQFAVVDVGAIAQLVEQLQTLEEQLSVARDHLAQAQQEYQSMTGQRGMERLLSDVVRNYLPTDWQQLVQVMQGHGGDYGVLSASVHAVILEDAVLTPEQLAALLPPERQRIETVRRSTALHQALARAALQNTSDRFALIQRLIDAIPSAADQKAILDLQARISAEQNMLQNEQTKLQILQGTALAEDRADRQIVREQVIAGHGRFESRFHPAP